MSTLLLAIEETHVSSRLMSTFKDAGFAVISVCDGFEAYRTARAVRPDIIVADYRLSRLGGLELCTKLHNDRATQNTPVILLTASGFGAPSDVHLPNIKRVLTKPVKPHAMLSLIRSILRRVAIPVGAC